jgi:hypothetical protein
MLNSVDYSLNQDVFLYSGDNGGQVLDFQHGQFYQLDSLGYEMLSLILEQGIKSTIAQLSEEYDVTPDRLQTDIHQLIQTLERQKLITRRQASVRPSLPFLTAIAYVLKPLFQSAPNPVTVNLLLVLSWLSFRSLGWGKTLTLWQTFHPQNPIPKKVLDWQQLDTLIRTTAASNILFPMVCKERALVGYQLLKAYYQLPAQLMVGIQLYPFQLHAWVECEGQILTDDPEHCQQFQVLTSYP